MNRRELLRSATAFTAITSTLSACSQTDEKPPALLDEGSSTSPNMTTDPEIQSIPDGTEQVSMLKRGEVSALELTQDAIARANAVEPFINAIATDSFEAALVEAETPPDGPFGGVPTFIKDLLNWKGTQTMFGSRAFEGFMPPEDAPMAAAWRKAGIISLGKSTTPEMGLISSTEPLATGATRNPYDLSRIPGGSSGGAAALVAARVVPFAHASDGGGSIRIPAACCGLFGLKPSRGALPISRNSGPVPISVNHAVTLTVRDSAALFAATENPTEGLSPTGFVQEPLSRRLRIAFVPDAAIDAPLDQETRAGLERTADLCRALGHEVIDWSFPFDGDEFGDKFLLYWAASAAEFTRQASQYTGKPPSPDFLEPWTLSLAAMFLQRRGELEETISYLKRFEAVYHSWFDNFDVLLNPTVTKLPPKIGSQTPDGDFETTLDNVLTYACFTSPMNVSGAASMSVPLQWSADGLPIGSMFSAKRGDDGLLLSLAYELESAAPWIDRLPKLKKT